MISCGYVEFRMNQRIRSIVRAAIKAKGKKQEEFVTGSSNVTDSSHPIAVRVTWLVIITVCFVLCVYQGSLRVQHYLTYPIIVDVNFEAREKLYFPVFTICTQETYDFQKIKEQCKIAIPEGEMACSDYNFLTLDTCPKYGIDYDTLWNAMNAKSMVNGSLILARGQGEVPLNFTEFLYPRGICLRAKIYEPISFGGFDTVLEIRARMLQEACPSALFAGVFEPPNSPIDVRLVYLASGTGSFAVHTVKEYSYINRPQVDSPCWRDQPYTQCQQQCIIDRCKRELKCRFPFVPKETNLPDCQLNLHDVLQEYTKAELMSYNTDPVTYCNCTKRCSSTVMIADLAMAQDYAKYPKFGIYFIQNLVTVMKEKLSVDLTALLCEIGGNAGLWLGFSVLSIFRLLHILFFQLIQKKKIHPESDYLYRKVNKILDNTECKSNLSNMRARALIIRTMVIIVCVIMNGLFLYSRACLYFSYPTKMVVSTKDLANVTFPLITICGESRSLAILKKKISNKRRKNCSEIDMFDVAKGNKYDSKERWDKSSLIKDFYNLSEVLKGKVSFRPFEKVTVTPHQLPSGTCAQFNIGDRPYYGSTSAFMTLAMGVSSNLLPCTADHYKIYSTPPDDKLDLMGYLKLHRHNKVWVLFRQQEVRLLDTVTHPCVDTKIYYKCRMQCLKNFTRKNVQCRLPYMTSVEISDCNTTQAARLASAAYMKFLMAMNLQRDCNCIRRCGITIYHRSEFLDVSRLDMGTIGVFSFASNLVEIFQEEEVYTISSFLCDVGGNLGLSIGFSVLSLFYGLQRIPTFVVWLHKHRALRRSRLIH